MFTSSSEAIARTASRRSESLALLTLIVMSGSARAADMVCNPTQLTASSPVSVVLPLPHGMDLAIVDTRGEYWFICFDQPDDRANLQPVYSAAICRSLPTLTLSADAVGVNFADYRRGRIFEEAGRYRVLVSESLETEEPILQGECVIEFQPAQDKP